MNFDGEPPSKWLVAMDRHLNDVYQRVPKYNSDPHVASTTWSFGWKASSLPSNNSNGNSLHRWKHTFLQQVYLEGSRQQAGISFEAGSPNQEPPNYTRDLAMCDHDPFETDASLRLRCTSLNLPTTCSNFGSSVQIILQN